jgi:hypothetical protein
VRNARSATKLPMTVTNLRGITDTPQHCRLKN